MTAERRLDHPPEEVWALVSDAGRQAEWVMGPGAVWASCRVKHASGLYAGLGARHIRVLEDAEGRQEVDRLETTGFEDDRHVAFSDGRSFTVAPLADGTLLTCSHDAVLSSGLGRAFRRAFRSEPELMGNATLEADLDRIEAALVAAADRRARAESAR